MMRTLLMLAGCWAALWCAAAAQDNESPSSRSPQDERAATSARAAEQSSSKDTRIDLSPPKDDDKNHPLSGAAVSDAGAAASDIEELHPWDPHRAAKDVEVGEFYFKRKNYRAAIERYRDALIYKPNDALAQFHLAESLEKTGNQGEALAHYREYLKILPHGPFAADAQKALERLKSSSSASELRSH